MEGIIRECSTLSNTKKILSRFSTVINHNNVQLSDIYINTCGATANSGECTNYCACSLSTSNSSSIGRLNLTVDIAVPLPKMLNVDLRPIYKFSSILQQLEQKTWKSCQFCNNPEKSALLQHHFDGIISSNQIEYERAEKERTKLVKEVASFVHQTITLQRQRRSPLLFAMGPATAILLEPLLEKAGCRQLSIFGLCESSKQKMEQLERLHYLETRMVHLHNEEIESIQVMASSSLKLHEDTRKVLNYSEDNFEILQTILEVLQKTIEEIEQAQACDHRRSVVFLYAFCAQSAINNVSWTLNAMHSELQVQTLYLTEQRNIFITSIGVLSKGILPAALVPYKDLRKIITTLGDKKCSIPYDHSSLLYSLPLVRNVFSNPHGLLITMEVPVYSGEPIHDAYKAISLPQPIKNTTTAATLKLERNYLIVSRREESYAEMKSEEYLSCLGHNC